MPTKIDPTVERICVEMLANPANRHLSTTRIGKLIEARLRDQGLEKLMPGRTWLFQARRRILENSQGPLDDHWTLTALHKFPIQLDAPALEIIESVRRLAIIGGQPFSVRQAIWVGRLRSLVPPEIPPFIRNWNLYLWATTMAREEVFAAVTEPRVDSVALDYLTMFHRIEIRPSSAANPWYITSRNFAQNLGYVPKYRAAKTGNATASDVPEEWRDSWTVHVIHPDRLHLISGLEQHCDRAERTGTRCEHREGRFMDLLGEAEYETVLLALRSLEAAGRFAGNREDDWPGVGLRLAEPVLHGDPVKFDAILKRETASATAISEGGDHGDA